MALMIELPSNIEQQLLQGATQKGISLESYLLQLLQIATDLPKKSNKKKRISELSEDDLLLKINSFTLLSESEWADYHRLMVLRRSETLTDNEYQILVHLSKKIEESNVERLKYLVALSKIRSVPLDDVMTDLGLLPVEP